MKIYKKLPVHLSFLNKGLVLLIFLLTISVFIVNWNEVIESSAELVFALANGFTFLFVYYNALKAGF